MQTTGIIPLDRKMLEAILDDIKPDINPLDLVRLTGYLEVLSSEPQHIQRTVKAYLENTESNNA